MQQQRLHMTIKGRVQGVCFRMESRERAQELDVTGWVRNRPDGTVEIVAEGDEDALRKFRKWCSEGPAMAVVRDIDAETKAASGEFEDFRIET